MRYTLVFLFLVGCGGVTTTAQSLVEMDAGVDHTPLARLEPDAGPDVLEVAQAAADAGADADPPAVDAGAEVAPPSPDAGADTTETGHDAESAEVAPAIPCPPALTTQYMVSFSCDRPNVNIPAYTTLAALIGTMCENDDYTFVANSGQSACTASGTYLCRHPGANAEGFMFHIYWLADGTMSAIEYITGGDHQPARCDLVLTPP